MAKNGLNSIPNLMRELFHTPDNYFLSHSVGCLPKHACDQLDTEFLNPWIDGSNWDGWMPILDTFRVGIATVLGTEARQICPQINISSALTKILYSLRTAADRKTIVLSRQDFPTVGFVFKQAEKAGFKLRFIDGAPTDITNWKNAIDETVAIVHVTHALSGSSHLLPVKDICVLARASGAVSIVDAAQSTGVVPVTPLHWDADFVVGTGVKFLCCGPGACFLYVASDILGQCEPVDVGWFSHENPFEMDIDHFKYADDAMRFFGGTPSPSPFAMANAALDMWSDIGLEKVQARIQSLLSNLQTRVPKEIQVSPRESGLRGAIFVVDPTDRKALHSKLAQSNIKYDERKSGFRFSIHGYTSGEEIDKLARHLI